jgi:hypothetical protein
MMPYAARSIHLSVHVLFILFSSYQGDYSRPLKGAGFYGFDSDRL